MVDGERLRDASAKAGANAAPAGVRLEDVRFRYAPDAEPMAFDLAVPRGALSLVTGPSGSGKSTVLSLVAGFETPERGHVLLEERDVTALAPAERPVTMIFQEHNLFVHLDAATNVALGIAPARRITRTDREEAADALAKVGLAGKGARMPGELSGGERQRVALARALLRDRPVLLLDEPFAALGPALAAEMLDLLAALVRGAGRTALLVTHQPRAAAHVADHVAFLADGKVHATGDPSLLETRTGIISDYLG